MRPKIVPRRTAAACVLIAVVLGAAASNLPAKDEDDDDLVSFEKEHPLGEVPGDGALLYVLRPTSSAFAIKSWFFRDQEVLGVNKGSSYFFTTLSPGKHVLWSKSENVDAPAPCAATARSGPPGPAASRTSHPPSPASRR